MNHYEVLGIPQNASQEDIRNAYITQIKFFHPDVFPGDPSIAKVKTWQLNVAYYVLHDPARRAEYDRSLSGVKNPPPSYSDTDVIFENDPPRRSRNPGRKKFRLSIAVICVLCALVIASAFSDGIPIKFKSDGSDAGSESQSSIISIDKSASEKEEENTAPILVPSTGQILYSDGQECVAPFSVVTRGTNDYYVKLKDAFYSDDVISFFVHGGETAEIDVPLGAYSLYYAVGDTWQGVEDLFGESTHFFKADDVFDFYESDGYVNGWTVELYTQSSGNLSTESIDPSEF